MMGITVVCSLTIGESGSISFEDLHFFDKQAHFNRERVPERVVHAKGAGAHGYFEVTQYVLSQKFDKFYPYEYLLFFCVGLEFPTWRATISKTDSPQ